MKLLVVKTGGSLPAIVEERGDFEHWIAQGVGVPLAEIGVVSVFRSEPLPAPDSPLGVIVTGSPSMVSERLEWSEDTAAWLRTVLAVETPVLGLCYGHQLIAHALGGRVGPNPRGREIGTVRVELVAAARRDPLLSGFPRELAAHASHVESVLSLPAQAEVLGATRQDPHHVLRFGPRAWGVQSHPEFDARTMAGYLEGRRELLESEGSDVDVLLASVRRVDADRILQRFFELCYAPGAPRG